MKNAMEIHSRLNVSFANYFRASPDKNSDVATLRVVRGDYMETTAALGYFNIIFFVIKQTLIFGYLL